MLNTLMNQLSKLFNTKAHQVLVLKTVIEEQTKMLNELRDVLLEEMKLTKDLCSLVKSLQDKQEGNTRPLSEFEGELARRARQEETDKFYTWRMDK